MKRDIEKVEREYQRANWYAALHYTRSARVHAQTTRGWSRANRMLRWRALVVDRLLAQVERILRAPIEGG